MQTFDQHLLQHLQAGRVTMEAAMRVATSPHDFKLMVAASSKGDDGPEATISSPAPQPHPESQPPQPQPQQPEPAAPRSYEPPPAPPSYEPPPAPASAPPPGVNY
jgi:twitching motility protein PilT